MPICFFSALPRYKADEAHFMDQLAEELLPETPTPDQVGRVLDAMLEAFPAGLHPLTAAEIEDAAARLQARFQA